jgi:anti-repressor protein
MSDTLTLFMGSGEGCPPIYLEDGKPWWVCKDIAAYLGYSPKSDINSLFTHVPDIWKGLKPIGTLGGLQNKLCVCREGLFHFLARSDKPKAQPYQLKVAGEIMPSIMEYGGYLTEAKIEEILTDPDTLIRLATDLKKAREERAVLMAKALEDAPKVRFADAVLEEDRDVPVKILAAEVFQAGNTKVGLINMHRLLASAGYTCMLNGCHVPTQKAISQGLLRLRSVTKTDRFERTRTFHVTMVTAKGRIRFVEIFGRDRPLKPIPVLCRVGGPRPRRNGLFPVLSWKSH